MNPEILELQKRVDAARIARARALAAHEQGEKIKAETLQVLRDKFGLDSLGDARAKLEQLNADLQTELEKVSNLLDKIE